MGIGRYFARIGYALGIGTLGLGLPGAAQAQVATVDANVGGAMECSALPDRDFTQISGSSTVLTAATLVAASGDIEEYCRVEGVIEPQIRFEVRLPTGTWNGRYLQSGCGGMCGAILMDRRYCPEAQAANFVIAAYDMGHQAGMWDGSGWGGEIQARNDYARRSTHAVAVAVKEIIATYYRQRAAFSYFHGCSTGGREAISEAQFFPEDFDGIIGGDFAQPVRQGAINNTWDAQYLVDENDEDVLTDDKIRLLHRAVMAKCDGLDGVEDGIIMDPRRCQFDPATLACPAGTDRPDCLNQRQVISTTALYRGPHNSAGVRLSPGGRAFGSELAWLAGDYGGGETRTLIANNALRYLVFGRDRPDFDYRDFDWDKDVARVEPQVSEFDVVAPGTSPDLHRFNATGRKLMLYHGWADPGVPPVNTLDYYAQVHTRMGGIDAVRDWFRVFMIPGMFHCRGGDAPDQFDFLSAMVAWVEQGVEPDGIVATQLNDDQTVKRTRPLYAYPAYAEYSGSGDVNNAENWHRAVPDEVPNDLIDWKWAPDPL